MSAVSRVEAREILDSRGNPTIEVEVILSDGSIGRASVPSGASTGTHEVVELRDGDPARFGGLGVLKAVETVRTEIAPAVVGSSALDQAAIDAGLQELDGTPDMSRLGGNAILGVSMAVARAAAASVGVPLYRRLSGQAAVTIPTPMFNVLNGGRHADDSTDVQEFMVVPAGLGTLEDAVRAGAEVYHTLKGILREKGFATNVGDEGGFAPRVDSNREALDLLLQAIQVAGYEPGRDCFIALDVAAGELQDGEGRYVLAREGRELSTAGLIDLYEEWLEVYPIVSIEDPMGEDDWDGWVELTRRLGARVQLVGDDLLTTDPVRIGEGIERRAANSVLIKPNQIGTVTRSLEAIDIARDAGWTTVVSHRSGETEDTFVADLAVGAATGQIKAGAPARGERTAKYNRLLRIEDELVGEAVYAGQGVYGRFHAGNGVARRSGGRK